MAAGSVEPNLIHDAAGERLDLRMTETDTPKSARKPRWTPLEMGLFTVVSLFLFIIVILMVLFATQSNKTCTTADCTHSASRLIQNMDASVDPCDNFYQYACGGWLKKNVIPETSSRYGVYDILNSNLEVILKGVLEKKVDREAAALTKAKTLYNSCINEKLIEQKGGRPLFDMLPDIFDWPIAVDNWETVYGKTWRLEDVLARLNWKYETDVLVTFIIDNDDRDSTSHIIYVDQQASFGLLSTDYYTCKGDFAKACEVYEQFMFDLAKLIRTDRGLKFNEAEIKAEATDPPEFRRDPVFLYNKIELRTLNRIFSFEIDSQRFNWSYFTAKIMDNVNIKVPESEKIINYSPRYYGKLKNVLAKYTKRDLQNYVVWRFLMKTIGTLSRAYRNTRNDFLKFLTGTTSEDAVWRRCALLVNAVLTKAVGRLYVQEAFSDNSKQLMEELIKDIREVFISNLNDLSWMDEKTKKAAEEKARTIRQRIGYSEDIMNDEYLNNEYKDLNFSAEEYFKNILRSMEYRAKKYLQKLREKVKNTWFVGAAVIDAFYSSNFNEIVFPAGILQPPYFSKGQPKSLNYGGIGMVIGHEITHGFDIKGRKFDKDGNLKDWWTPESTEKFLQFSRCIVDQYSNFSWDLANGLHLNGDNTLRENIADNGGIRLAYQAYKKFVERNGEEPLLPGIDLSHDQLFFLNFGQIWCESYRLEQAVNSINVDVHSPGMFRVLGSLQNFPEFAKAFTCKKSSNMVSENVCRVW
ncbi:neprilysin-like isoform X2 [Poeciliopsis prolifica]|uniref:neprilysin-like isoform X2 n=1 Tax=Poeciliopsis prolifica TaxID=188132 RepID=UPI0024137C4F|nr:neprilysin-like isoform X2 [Poeciliopsis prolifica]